MRGTLLSHVMEINKLFGDPGRNSLRPGSHEAAWDEGGRNELRPYSQILHCNKREPAKTVHRLCGMCGIL